MLKYGLTVLHIAAHNPSEQIVKILIEHGANVHLQDQVFIFFFFDFDFNFYFLVFSHFFICCCDFLVGCFMLIVNGCCVM